MPKKRATNNIIKLLDAKEDIKREKAQEAGELGYMGRVLVMTTLPHSETKEAVFERESGLYTLRVSSWAGHGLPYGTYPRLILAWLVTKAVRTRHRTIVLPVGVKAFMREVGVENASGNHISEMRKQARRLFTCSFVTTTTSKDHDYDRLFTVAEEVETWWTSAEAGNISVIELSEKFFNELIKHPVPIDLRAYRALKHSPLAMDIYTWLTYRMSSIKKPTKIAWSRLQAQFGAGYATDTNGRKNFQRKFCKAIDEVLVVYDQAQVHKSRGQLILHRSPTHISRKKSI